MAAIKTLAETIKSVPIEKSDYNWKIEKVVPHTMHKICSRICSFPPSLPSFFIRKFTKKGDVVFDAWSGKATVPLEALRNGRIGIGNDKSPEAFVITRAKTNPVKMQILEWFLKTIEAEMKKQDIPDGLTELDKKARVFYSQKTFDQILRLREVLKGNESNAAVFVKAIVMGLLHGNSLNSFSLRCSHSYSMSPNYVRKYAKLHHLRRPTRNVIDCIKNKGEIILKDPLPPVRGAALNDDSRDIGLESESVNMILSSPPYFDVQTYAWCNWLRLWFLGHDYREVKKGLAESGMESKYRNFMRDSIKELHRVLVPGGRCFIVVGDVRKSVAGGYRTINTAEFILPLLMDQGFELEKILVDEVPANKRVISYIQEDEGIKIERILILNKI